MRGKTKITVRKSCRQKYTRPSSIRAAIKQKETCETAPSTSSVLRSSEGKFDSKCPQHSRKPVHLISTLEIRENVIAKCNERCDDWGEGKCRLLNVSNLVEPEARYHKYCYRDFLKTTARTDTVGRPKSELGEAFEKLCKYMKIATSVSILYKNYRV